MEKQEEEEGGAPRLVPGEHFCPLPPPEGQQALGLPGRGGWAGHACSRQSQPPLPHTRNFSKRRNIRPDSEPLPAFHVDWEHLLEKPHTAVSHRGRPRIGWEDRLMRGTRAFLLSQGSRPGGQLSPGSEALEHIAHTWPPVSSAPGSVHGFPKLSAGFGRGRGNERPREESQQNLRVSVCPSKNWPRARTWFK